MPHWFRSATPQVVRASNERRTASWNPVFTKPSRNVGSCGQPAISSRPRILALKASYRCFVGSANRAVARASDRANVVSPLNSAAGCGRPVSVDTGAASKRLFGSRYIGQHHVIVGSDPRGARSTRDPSQGYRRTMSSHRALDDTHRAVGQLELDGEAIRGDPLVWSRGGLDSSSRVEFPQRDPHLIAGMLQLYVVPATECTSRPNQSGTVASGQARMLLTLKYVAKVGGPTLPALTAAGSAACCGNQRIS